MDADVKTKFKSYPKEVAERLLRIRCIIFRTAEQAEISDLQETLKWGQPSYLSKIGSTIRYDWSPKSPNEFRLYFHCQTRLIDTFKEVYGDIFVYEGNRALVFKFEQTIPAKEVSHCVRMALEYKKLKHLRLLGR
jgi:hypothetical protein